MMFDFLYFDEEADAKPKDDKWITFNQLLLSIRDDAIKSGRAKTHMEYQKRFLKNKKNHD